MQANSDNFFTQAPNYRIFHKIFACLYRNTAWEKEDSHVKKLAQNINFLAVGINFLLFALKLLFALLTGSISILVDSFNNLSDSVSSVVALIGMKLSTRPPDSNHPHGYAVIEHLTALFVSILVLIIGLSFAKSALERLFNPEPIIFKGETLLILLFSIFIKFFMYHMYKIGSEFLHALTFKATAMDALSDIYATSVIVFSYLIIPFTSLPLDSIVALLLSLLIINNALGLIGETVSLLIGKKIDPESEKRLLAILDSEPEVKGYFDLRYHEFGDYKVAAIDLEVPADMTIAQIHYKIDALEQKILNDLGIKLFTHFEPKFEAKFVKKTFSDSDKQLLCLIQACSQQFRANSTLHDFLLDHEKRIIRFDLEYPLVDAKETFEAKDLQKALANNLGNAIASAKFANEFKNYELQIGIFPKFN